MAKRKKSLKQRYAEQKKEAIKKAKITRLMNKFIKENKEQILTKGKEDLGNISDSKVLDIFKANFRERQADSLSTAKAKKELKKTLHTETFTGKETIDFENVMNSLGKEGRKEFRKLRGWNEKINIENFKKLKVSSAEENVRAKYKYTSLKNEVILTLIYHPDGSYEWLIKEVL